MAATSAKELAAAAQADAGGGSLYRRDGWSWAQQQAEALKRRDLRAIDWDNVIEEIESVGRAEKGRWVSNCARALGHMLAVEHWKGATAGDLQHWETEIRAFRLEMAAAIRANPGLQGEYAGMLSEAWADGRARAVERLAGYAAGGEGASSSRPNLRIVDAQLPDECPYLAEHVAAYDPRRDKQPRSDVWPPGVAVAFNSGLGTNYEILRADSRGRAPQRGHDWTR